MKILSHTEEGGRVVELSKSEMRELFLLMKSCDDEAVNEQGVIWETYARGVAEETYIHEYNFTHLFSLVRAWRDAKFSLNAFRDITSKIEKAIG